MTAPHPLRSALAAAEDLVPAAADALRAALDAIEAPVRWVVLGRVGAGKTTVINHWTGGQAATGLGGVTREPTRHDLAGVTLWDTPGVDDPDTAIVRLGALLDGVDGIVWVVDGLQPLTASERTVVDELVDADVHRVRIVSRGDLLTPEDAVAVTARVEALTGGPAEVWDLRRQHPPVPSWAPSPRRHEQLMSAITAVHAALDALPSPRLAALRLRFRDAIRTEVQQLEAQIERGTVRDKNEALAALGRRADQVFATTLADVPGPHPRLPGPARPGDHLVRQVLDRFSGQEGARRILKAEAARWLMEGQMALEEWWLGRDDLRERADAIDDLRRRLPLDA